MLYSFHRSLVSILLGVLVVSLPGRAASEAEPGADLQPEVRHLVPPSSLVPDKIRLVTFNVHSGRDLPALAESIGAHPTLRNADIFLLQEIESYESEGASRTRKLAEALQFNYVYAPARATDEGGTHGLAILSRFPLSDIEVLPLKQYDLNYKTRRRIALAATLDVAGRPLRVYNLHLDTRLNTKDRLEQLRPVVEAALAQPVADVVIGGDFNTNAFRWLFHVLPIFRSDQAGAVDDFMKENGFETPFAEAGPTSRKRLLRFRLDSLYSQGLPVGKFGVERSVESSDHVPLWMELLWPASPAGER